MPLFSRFFRCDVVGSVPEPVTCPHRHEPPQMLSQRGDWPALEGISRQPALLCRIGRVAIESAWAAGCRAFASDFFLAMRLAPAVRDPPGSSCRGEQLCLSVDIRARE